MTSPPALASPREAQVIPGTASPRQAGRGIATGRAANKINAVVLLKALRRRLTLALTLGSLCAAIAVGLVWMFLPTSAFTVTSILRVDSVPQTIIFKTSEQQIDFATYQRTQVSLIKSRMVLNAALRDPKVRQLDLLKKQADPITWLEKSLQVDYAGEMLRISMSGSDPRELVILVNAVTDSYIGEIVNSEVKKRRERYDKLQDLYRGYQSRLQERRNQLRSAADQVGSKDQQTIRYNHELAIERRALAERELMRIRYNLRSAKAEHNVRKEVATSVLPGRVPDSLVELRLEQDPQVRQASQRLAQAQARYQEAARTIRNKNDPALLRHGKEYNDTKASLEARRSAARSRILEELSTEPLSRTDANLLELRQQIATLEELERLAVGDVESISTETQSLNRGAWNVEEIQDEIATIETASQRIATEVEALNVELDAPARVRLFEKAEQPRQQSDKRLMMMAAAGGCALALTLMGISLLEVRAQRVSFADEVTPDLRLRLMGSMPALPTQRWGRPNLDDGVDSRWRHLLIESIDTTRSILLHACDTQAVRSLMITSATGGEGKTTLATHLATSIARSGRRTLLVDCDLRKSSVHRVFDIPLTPGLSELLRGEASLEEVLQPVAGGLWVLTAGLVDTRAIEALAKERAKSLFGMWKNQFDFVLVDTPPILPVADTLFIGQHVDAAVCSILSGVSRVPKVGAANERLVATGIHILGAVMVGERWDRDRSKYAYGKNESATGARERTVDLPEGRA